MTNLKVRYSIHRNNGKYSFELWNDLNEKERNQLLNLFLLWERQVRKSACTHYLNNELQLNSEKLLTINVNNKKSPTSIG